MLNGTIKYTKPAIQILYWHDLEEWRIFMKTLEGNVVAESGLKIGIVAARFNEFIVSKLVSGARDGLVRHGVDDNNITLAWVPGAFEIPLWQRKWLCQASMTQLSALVL